jgi:hypothetical protein
MRTTSENLNPGAPPKHQIFFYSGELHSRAHAPAPWKGSFISNFGRLPRPAAMYQFAYRSPNPEFRAL